MIITIKPDGEVVCLYTEEIELSQIGELSIRRASHVEPNPNGTGWIADMAPSNGPILGPYSKRSEALQAEISWLESRF